MENNKKITVSLVGITNVLVFLAFFFAKIFDKIDWSWWWVFCPLWIPIAFVLFIIIMALISYFIIVLISKV
jgi:hypothetical protein